MTNLYLTPTSITSTSTYPPPGIASLSRASTLARQIRATRCPEATPVHLGACDDEYNMAGGVFRSCTYTAGELLTHLDAHTDAFVCANVEGAKAWDLEIDDFDDAIQVTFYADLNDLLPAGVPADL